MERTPVDQKAVYCLFGDAPLFLSISLVVFAYCGVSALLSQSWLSFLVTVSGCVELGYGLSVLPLVLIATGTVPAACSVYLLARSKVRGVATLCGVSLLSLALTLSVVEQWALRCSASLDRERLIITSSGASQPHDILTTMGPLARGCFVTGDGGPIRLHILPAGFGRVEEIESWLTLHGFLFTRADEANEHQ